jgi:hypothetical protein
MHALSFLIFINHNNYHFKPLTTNHFYPSHKQETATMQFSTIPLLAALTASVASATQMQINYYSDQCSSYEGSVEVNWATNIYNGPNNCYNYQYGTWANIANCWESSGCRCNFYNSPNCQNYSGYTASGTGNCIPVSGAQSFQCWYGSN